MSWVICGGCNRPLPRVEDDKLPPDFPLSATNRRTAQQIGRLIYVGCKHKSGEWVETTRQKRQFRRHEYRRGSSYIRVKGSEVLAAHEGTDRSWFENCQRSLDFLHVASAVFLNKAGTSFALSTLSGYYMPVEYDKLTSFTRFLSFLEVRHCDVCRCAFCLNCSRLSAKAPKNAASCCLRCAPLLQTSVANVLKSPLDGWAAIVIEYVGLKGDRSKRMWFTKPGSDGAWRISFCMNLADRTLRRRRSGKLLGYAPPNDVLYNREGRRIGLLEPTALGFQLFNSEDCGDEEYNSQDYGEKEFKSEEFLDMDPQTGFQIEVRREHDQRYRSTSIIPFLRHPLLDSNELDHCFQNDF